MAHSLEEIRLVLNSLRLRAAQSWTDHRLFAVAATAAYTGLRRDEVLTLEVGDVDLMARLLTVSDRARRKTEASAAQVPIAAELAEVLASWIAVLTDHWPLTTDHSDFPWLFPGVKLRGPWTGGACGTRACDQLRAAGAACGVADLTFASLRHTFATLARREWGMTAIEVQDILRHTSAYTQNWYIDPPRPEQLVASVARVSFGA